MQNNRFFFFIMGMCWIQNICAMELFECNDGKKRDVAINMQHFWSDGYIHNISSIQNLDLKKMRLDLKKEQFLPDHSDALHHLLYLSTIRKYDNKTLFTHKQQNKFDTALQVQQSVPLFFGINGAVIVGTALFPFTNLASLLQCSNATQTYCLSQTNTIMTPTVISVAGALMVGFVSLYATGLSPDLSSRKADKVQDEIGHLSRKYATIAKYWIDIYFNCPEKAQYIAHQFDVEVLKQRAQLKTHKTKIGNDLVNPLEEAWHFIKHNNILITFTEIENYLYNKIHSRHIESLIKRIDLLEKVIQEKDAKVEKLNQEHI